MVGKYVPLQSQSARYLDDRVTILEHQVDYLVAMVHKLAHLAHAELDVPEFPTLNELWQQREGVVTTDACPAPPSSTATLSSMPVNVAATEPTNQGVDVPAPARPDAANSGCPPANLQPTTTSPSAPAQAYNSQQGNTTALTFAEP